ncbi:MAG: DUF2474 domain-containing protein [Alphaproteobacteria bacterium]|nr:MAG: DUF2474 domain-containing protein [Alphaproteobacteria bacterium]
MQRSSEPPVIAPLWKRLVWMAAIWLASVSVLGAIAAIIKLTLSS